MIQELKSMNPALSWVRETFDAKLELLNGHLISVRFDLNSTGVSGYTIDTKDVEQYFGQAILDATKSSPYNDEVTFPEVCSAIADTLNERMQLKAQEIYRQAQLTYEIQYALGLNDYIKALQYLEELLESLKGYLDDNNTRGKFTLWNDWLILAVRLATCF